MKIVVNSNKFAQAVKFGVDFANKGRDHTNLLLFRYRNNHLEVVSTNGVAAVCYTAECEVISNEEAEFIFNPDTAMKLTQTMDGKDLIITMDKAHGLEIQDRDETVLLKLRTIMEDRFKHPSFDFMEFIYERNTIPTIEIDKDRFFTFAKKTLFASQSSSVMANAIISYNDNDIGMVATDGYRLAYIAGDEELPNQVVVPVAGLRKAISVLKTVEADDKIRMYVYDNEIILYTESPINTAAVSIKRDTEFSLPGLVQDMVKMSQTDDFKYMFTTERNEMLKRFKQSNALGEDEFAMSYTELDCYSEAGGIHAVYQCDDQGAARFNLSASVNTNFIVAFDGFKLTSILQSLNSEKVNFKWNGYDGLPVAFFVPEQETGIQHFCCVSPIHLRKGS